MSLTTRCPACGTVFRVVPDQLKVSEGWVRCGRCSELFDARATLSPQVPVVSEVVEPQEAGSQITSPANALEDTGTPVAAAVATTPAMSEPVLAEGDPEPVAPMAPVAHDSRQPAWNDTPLAAPVPDALAPVDERAETPPAEPGTPAPVVDQVSFMRRARRQAFWRRPAVRVASGTVALLLALALGGQVAYEHRDELAQRVPALQPLLTALCQPLQCRIGPPRRIEAITIDTSAFSRLQPDAFRLQFTLANAASLPVALPALELTLTDNQDQPVIRRVLQPADLGADAPSTLPPQGEWASAVTLTVSPAAAGTVSGYRLLAFYP